VLSMKTYKWMVAIKKKPLGSTCRGAQRLFVNCQCTKRIACGRCPQCKNRGSFGRGFCNKKRGEEKMKKKEVIYIYIIARSDIRACI